MGLTMTPRFIARQLAHPRGLLGRLIMRLMNRHNARLNTFAIQTLDVGPSDRVLEVGFGGGSMLPYLLDHAAFTAGVDRSAAAVERARASFASSIQSGRADFQEGSVEALPYEAGSFSRVLTVNTIYFWTSLETGFKEMRRVLAPGGKVAVGFLPREGMERMGTPPDIFTMREPDDVIAALRRAGFEDVRAERPTPATGWIVISGRGPVSPHESWACEPDPAPPASRPLA